MDVNIFEDANEQQDLEKSLNLLQIENDFNQSIDNSLFGNNIASTAVNLSTNSDLINLNSIEVNATNTSTTTTTNELFYAGESTRLSARIDDYDTPNDASIYDDNLSNDDNIFNEKVPILNENSNITNVISTPSPPLQTSNENNSVKVDEITNDDGNNEEFDLDWRTKDKHIFILSEAGKPIYTMHGNEVHLITLMGLMQALNSVIECDKNNRLKYIIAGEHKFLFMHKDHLIFVNVSKEKNKCVEQLYLELQYIYYQIISVITLSLINKIFKTHHNYDLRNKLTGTEKLLDNIIKHMKNDYGMLLSCVSCYPLVQDTREQIAKLLVQNISQVNYVLFALLFVDNRLIALIRPKKKQLHPIDIHLLLNVITGLDTPKTYAEFTCYPICLPNYDSSALMYANISYLDELQRSCLILLTGLCDHEQSLKLNECRKRIQDKFLANYAYLFRLQVVKPTSITSSTSLTNPTTMQMDATDKINQEKPLIMPLNDEDCALKQIDVSELKHFLFKDRKLFQYYVTDYSLPYSISSEQKQRLFDIYQNLYHKLHNQTYSLRIIYYRQNYETVLGWLASEFELYVTFSSLITKDSIIAATNKLLEFIRRNKTKLFITSMPTLPN